MKDRQLPVQFPLHFCVGTGEIACRSLCYSFGSMFRKSILVCLFVLMGCGKLKELPTAPDGSGEPIDPTATFSRVQNEIFTPTCAAIGCHDTLGRQQGMVLSPGRAYSNIVGVPSTEMASLQRVAPNDFANSYLYRKITGVGITGVQMPNGGPYLSGTQIKL